MIKCLIEIKNLVGRLKSMRERLMIMGIFVLLLFVVMVFSGCFLKTNPPPSNATPKSSFEKNANDGMGFSGEVYASGYAVVNRVPEAFCEENCPEYDYVVFYVLETDSKAFNRFLAQSAGNAYVGEGSVGLGCLNDGRIVYENGSDEFGSVSTTLSENLTRAIVGSEKEAPIRLKLTRLPLSSGRGAPTCYSHFTTVELAE